MVAAARVAAAVREPTCAEMQEFDCLGDILTWAGVKGKSQHDFTQAGSLLKAIAGVEFQTITAGGVASDLGLLFFTNLLCCKTTMPC